MKVLAHPDPHTLERELLARVDAVHPRSALGRTLIVVPTSRLARHLARRLAAVRPAWLGLEVLHFQRLAQTILAGAGAPAPRVARSRLLESILDGLLRRPPESFWAAFARRRPGVIRHLAESLSDLREAGVEPAEFEACATGAPRVEHLARLYREYHAALAAIFARGFTDAAGLARAAVPHASAWASKLDAAFLHGAYEVVGVHLDLLREIDRAVRLTALVPLAAEAPATSHAERFTRAFLLEPGAMLESLGGQTDPARTLRLAALYDEGSRPPASPAGAVTFRHAQGPTAEVRAAVRDALRSVGEGCPPEEIAIVARSLSPYAAALEEVFDGEGLAWDSSLDGPLRRQPIVRDFLLLLRVLDQGFPRRATAELLRSPRIAWTALNGDGVPRGDRADAWSRKARILGGLDEWSDDLARWAASDNRGAHREELDPAAEARTARRREDVRRIGTALAALDQALPRDPATWGAHARALRTLLSRVLVLPGEDRTAAAAHDALLELLSDMGRLEAISGDARAVAFGDARTWLEQATDGAVLPACLEDRGGFRVLDVMQARGLTFRQVHWLGLNGDLFPRPPREDAVLPDALRRSIAAATSRPLPIKAEGPGEERLLLALVLGSASERVHVSWQRADESGRARTRSPALREIARFATGRPDGALARDQATHLPSHPEHWLESLAQGTQMLTADEARLLQALKARDEGSIAVLGRRWPDLSIGVRMLQATQSFEPGSGEYDGRIGPVHDPAELAVSALEQLGRCPLQFFFNRVLRVGEFEEEASAVELDPRELGTEIHATLASIYVTLHEEGLFERGTAEALVERGRALLAQRRDTLLGEVGARLARRIPIFGGFQLARWRKALERFLDHDLACIRAEGWSLASLEALRVKEIDLGQGIALRLRGKFDRLLEREGKTRIGDYKTSTKLESRVGLTPMLRGERLQVPLYWKMASGDGHQPIVELLAIHPDVDPEGIDGRATFPGFDPRKPELLRSFDETLRVLVSMWRQGIFPFREHELHCTWCSYGKACRRTHPPSVEREGLYPDVAAYRLALSKTTVKPDGR